MVANRCLVKWWNGTDPPLGSSQSYLKWYETRSNLTPILLLQPAFVQQVLKMFINHFNLAAELSKTNDFRESIDFENDQQQNIAEMSELRRDHPVVWYPVTKLDQFLAQRQSLFSKVWLSVENKCVFFCVNFHLASLLSHKEYLLCTILTDNGYNNLVENGSGHERI